MNTKSSKINSNNKLKFKNFYNYIFNLYYLLINLIDITSYFLQNKELFIPKIFPIIILNIYFENESRINKYK